MKGSNRKSNPSTKGLRILIVDDDRNIRYTLRRLITSHDPFHEIIGEAENGKQAVQMALGLKPNVILMDADMPVMDGAKATRLILNNQPGMPILAISMHRDEDCFGNI